LRRPRSIEFTIHRSGCPPTCLPRLLLPAVPIRPAVPVRILPVARVQILPAVQTRRRAVPLRHGIRIGGRSPVTSLSRWCCYGSGRTCTPASPFTRSPTASSRRCWPKAKSLVAMWKIRKSTANPQSIPRPSFRVKRHRPKHRRPQHRRPQPRRTRPSRPNRRRHLPTRAPLPPADPRSRCRRIRSSPPKVPSPPSPKNRRRNQCRRNQRH
jgi:hypothetical protein